MGLDAVVYKNLENLPEQLRQKVRLVNQATGELALFTGCADDSLFALRIRIGNIAKVGWLRQEIISRWPDKYPVILSSFLYSGSHSGDAISLESISAIRREIEHTDFREGSPPQSLLQFFLELQQLLDAAEDERNPIAFY